MGVLQFTDICTTCNGSALCCRAIGQEIAALPGSTIVGFIKVSAKPLKTSLATWASKWGYLFTHYLQVRLAALTSSVCPLNSWQPWGTALLAIASRTSQNVQLNMLAA